VIEPVKGTKKGEVIQTLTLATRDSRPISDAPGMVDPKVGQFHLLCLLPTNLKGAYASITAPFDDDLGIFLLDRKRWSDTNATYYKDHKEVAFYEVDDKNYILWNLVNDNGEINQDGIEYLRNKYKTEIDTPGPEGAIIHLKWKTETSAGGWQRNVPDETNRVTETNNDWETHGPITYGPITKP
jgi:hypothetical protein